MQLNSYWGCRLVSAADLSASRLGKEEPRKEQHKDKIICPVDTKERAGKEVLGIELRQAVLR
jgi:hypothetical protein